MTPAEGMGSSPIDGRVVARGVGLILDAATARFVGELEDAGVPSILLKGPSVARWLYPEEGRLYTDIDLLVPAGFVHTAERIAARLGFHYLHGDMHSRLWALNPEVSLDLHHSVQGADTSPTRVWEELNAGTQTLQVGGREIRVLALPGLVLLVALHAAQHGTKGSKPLADLDRALERVPEAVWNEALELAGRIDATAAFVSGLRLAPSGALLADRLGLPERAAGEMTLRAGDLPPVADGLIRLAKTRGLRARAILVAGEIAPTPAFMRSWSRLAHRGPLGLGVAYLWRSLWLVWRSIPAYLAWRRASKPRRD
jgi:hypothetical protein